MSVAGPPGAFASIWKVVARIPRGRVATYGQVARMAGLPGAARTVGWAMGALPDEPARGPRVPWHRVINAAGRVSVRGRGGGACRRQMGLLRREGIRQETDGSIDLERYGWDGRVAPIKPAVPGALRRSPAPRPNWSSHRRA